MELRAAVAPDGVEDVTGQTCGVHASEDVLAAADLPADQRHVRPARKARLVDVDRKLPILGRQRGGGCAANGGEDAEQSPESTGI